MTIEKMMIQGAPLNHNLQRMEYWHMVRQIDVNRIKFVDEVVIQGVTRRVRRDPLTGLVDPYPTDPSNTVRAIGFCGVGPTTHPIDYYVHTGTPNDSAFFSACVTSSVAKGFLRPWDVLVLDSKRVHRSREVSILKDRLYDTHRIFLVYLPQRSPDLNPMKQLWKEVMHRLSHWNLNNPWMPCHAVAAYSQAYLESFTHRDVYDAYRMCGYCL